MNGHTTALYLPLRPVQRLGQRTMRDGMYIGLICALLAHALAIGGPQHTLWPMRLAVAAMNHELREYFKRAYDIDVVDDDKPEEDPAPPTEPEAAVPVEPEPVEQQPAEPEREPEPDDPYPEDVRADAAEAQDIMDAPLDPSSPSWGMADKDGSSSRATGNTSGEGTQRGHVDDEQVEPKKKGRRSRAAKQPRPEPAPRQNRSRAASVSGTGWSCPWPAQADLYDVDHAAVTLRILVGEDGRAKSVTVNSDPGHGFGAMARRCAMGRAYIAATDADGDATAQSIQVRVTFRR